MTVPRIAFSFWEGNQFTYMHYLTFVTFSKYNPDFKIIIYRTLKDSQPLRMWDTHEQDIVLSNICDINQLKELPNVEFIYIDFEKELDYHNPLSSVWKSDIVRILKLYEHGGIYIDFDTLFIKKIDESLLSMEHDIGLNEYDGAINNAFMIARPKSKIVRIILDNILDKLHSNQISNNYQQFGPSLFVKLIMNTPLQQSVYFIPNEMTCPYIWNEMDRLFHSTIKQHTDNTFCIHWYNGGPISRAYCSTFNIHTVNKNNNNFESLLAQSLQ